jgi:hypothetical protein
MGLDEHYAFVPPTFKKPNGVPDVELRESVYLRMHICTTSEGKKNDCVPDAELQKGLDVFPDQRQNPPSEVGDGSLLRGGGDGPKD